jgi:hypothetical protein
VVIKVTESENPPLHLLLGGAAYEVATEKFTNLLNDMEIWKETTINTDFKE